MKKARVSLQKRKSKTRKTESDTQPLEEAFPVSAWLAAALTLVFLGVGCYTLYEILFQGMGG